jgi:hypothetical protein
MATHRNVFRRYPIRLLPDDLREGFERDALVTVTIEFDASESDEFAETEFEYLDGVVVRRSTRILSEQEFRIDG